MSRRPDALYLHIGHGKTGSSYLQSALALSDDQLAAHDLIYPIDPKTAEIARKGHITGGNLRFTPGGLAQLVASGVAGPGQRLLVSSESYFQHMPRQGATLLDELKTVAPDMAIHVLLYLRDPVDHAVSAYHQQIKRGGATWSLAESLEKYEAPGRTLQVLTHLQGAGAQITVLNYSRHSKALIHTLETWLGMPDNTLTTPTTGQVNRSLTNAELELQRAFNLHFEVRGRHYVSDPLCNALPDIRAETPPLAPDALAAFLERTRDIMTAPDYLALVPEAERPWIGSVSDHADRFPTPQDTPTYTFTADQIGVFATAIAERLKRLETVTAAKGRQNAGPGKGGKGGKGKAGSRA